MQNDSFGDALIERMKMALCCKNYAEVCTLLDVKPGLLAQCRRTGQLGKTLEEKLLLHGISPLWVERGIGWELLNDPVCSSLPSSTANSSASDADANFYTRKIQALRQFRESLFPDHGWARLH